MKGNDNELQVQKVKQNRCQNNWQLNDRKWYWQ